MISAVEQHEVVADEVENAMVSVVRGMYAV